LSKLWFSPMITTTCLIGVVVGAAWLAPGGLPAAAAVTVAATASATLAAPATATGWMYFLAMQTPLPVWAGIVTPRIVWQEAHGVPLRSVLSH
jgi:hypothetical protein